MEIKKYPDGTSYVTIPKEWEDTDQDIIFKINKYEDVLYFAQLCDVLIHNRVRAHITIPCLLDAQADRRFNEFQSSGLLVLARILDTYVDGYNISISIFHPHNPEVVEALFTGVNIIDNSNFINKVIEELNWKNLVDNNNLRHDLNSILMSSDAGGFKPLMKLCDTIEWQGETASANKARRYINNKSDLNQGVDRDDYKGKDILIVDDISVYGGTFKGLSTLLKQRNCGKLYLAVSHMTMQNLGPDPVTNYFDKVFTTNSKFHSYVYGEKDGSYRGIPSNLDVINLFKDD